jgi:excisionase family DNA binding protein
VARQELLSVDDVAQIAKLSAKTVRRAIERGDLVGHKVCGRWRIRESDFEAWIERGRFVAVGETSPKRPASSEARGSIAALRRIGREAA